MYYNIKDKARRNENEVKRRENVKTTERNRYRELERPSFARRTGSRSNSGMAISEKLEGPLPDNPILDNFLYYHTLEETVFDLALVDEEKDLMEELTMLRIEEREQEFLEKYQTTYWIKMRLDYLLDSTEENLDKVRKMYWDRTLIPHLKKIQIQAMDFMKKEKPLMMKSWKIQSEEDPEYQTMISALTEIMIKEIIES